MLKKLLICGALCSLPSVSFAQATSGCGACSFPEEKAASALRLEEQIQDADHQFLRRLLLIGEICSANGLDCGELTEEEAGRLAEFHFASSRAWWDGVQKAALGFVAFAGLALGIANRYAPRG